MSVAFGIEQDGVGVARRPLAFLLTDLLALGLFSVDFIAEVFLAEEVVYYRLQVGKSGWFEVQANAHRLFQSVIHLRQAFGHKRKAGDQLMRCVAPSVCPSSQDVDDGLRSDFLIDQLKGGCG